ncbi:sushi domain-containing protein 2 isoform X4 [Festucalex cinctus]
MRRSSFLSLPPLRCRRAEKNAEVRPGDAAPGAGVPPPALRAGESCESKCGQSWSSCSCQPTCASLGSCCSDYKEFCVEFAPQSGSILGGTDFLVLHATFNQTSFIECKFNDDIRTVGYVDESGRAHCISPLLYQTGWVSVKISSNYDVTFNRVGSWLAVHTGKLDSKLKAVLVNATKWQYYGTPQVGGHLQMTWDSTLVRAQRVNVELWGYRETGKPYSEQWRGEWTYLYSLAKDIANNGSFAFVPQPSPEFWSWELGALRVSSSVYPNGLKDVQAAWTEDHALAWHLQQEFRDDSQAWALAKCLAWDRLENDLPDFLGEIIDCPCTLAQARADTGRFHTDYGCDMDKGSVCTYHPGSIHCVRAIQASPTYGAGQQCCYDSSGAQVLTADSIGGSTPDRAHDWGSPPYVRPPRVPGQSHWVYDVLSFYYCCLWSDNCHYYFKHRPSSDCRRYQPPTSAAVFGDPHFITFDGVRYSFNGKGEYNLLEAPAKRLTIQGRNEPVLNGNATKLSSVVMKEALSDVIEVRLVAADDNLQVLQNQKPLAFNEQSWMDLNAAPAWRCVSATAPWRRPCSCRKNSATPRGGCWATRTAWPATTCFPPAAGRRRLTAATPRRFSTLGPAGLFPTRPPCSRTIPNIFWTRLTIPQDTTPILFQRFLSPRIPTTRSTISPRTFALETTLSFVGMTFWWVVVQSWERPPKSRSAVMLLLWKT